VRDPSLLSSIEIRGGQRPIDECSWWQGHRRRGRAGDERFVESISGGRGKVRWRWATGDATVVEEPLAEDVGWIDLGGRRRDGGRERNVDTSVAGT